MDVENLRRMANRLISDRSDIELIQNTKTGFDTVNGKNIYTTVTHYIKAYIGNYQTSDIVSGVIDIDDLRIVIYSDDILVTKEWELKYNGDMYKILSVVTTTDQNKNIIYTLQCRGRNA